VTAGFSALDYKAQTIAMDSKKLITFIVLSFAILFGQSWIQKKYAPPVKPVSTVSDLPAAQSPVTTMDPNTATLQQGERIVVKTDVATAVIDTIGGDLREWVLIKQANDHDSAQTFTLLADNGKPHLYVAQTGLISNQQSGLPTHKTPFVAEKHAYELTPAQNQLSVRLTAPEVDGIKVSKIYTFHRGSYLIDVRYDIQNTAATPITLSAYYRLLRDGKEPPGTTRFASTFYGAALYTEEGKFQKNTYEDIEKGKASYPTTTQNGWIGMLQHYFATAWILTPTGKPNVCAAGAANACRFEMKRLTDGLYSVGAIVDLPEIAAGATKTVEVPLFAGPEETRIIDAIAPGFDLVKDYGWFTVISKPIFWVLDHIHALVGNWGWAIVILTVLIKALFFPLSAASYRSMAKMRTLGPRMQALKERHNDDKVKFQQAVMTMYKEEKVNPLGGCLPMLVQIPVFIALYWALLASVELRHAPWIFWIKDLSQQDPYYVLPVLMAVSMFLQTYLSPPPPDPMQAKMMKIMPIVFSVMFFFFPAGLVLYWVVNNILSIAQQWYITRSIERENHAKK
jgi:YidC/Oxa1 family membrane protein insertase